MKRFERVILASDIDGTFLASEEEGKRRNREAIEYFKSEGGHFTFSTGRNFRQILGAIPDAAELVNLPAVTCNGASLYDFQRKREMERYLMDNDSVVELLNWLNEEAPTVGVRAATEDEFWFTSLENPYIREDFDALRAHNPRMVPLCEWGRGEIYKLAVRDDEDILFRLRPVMMERFGDRMAITQSDPTLVDVQAAGRTKAVLLRELKQSAGIQNPFLCVAGDYDNDLEMLHEADLPCCPSNAQDCVKAVCKKEVCHYQQGAIAEIIEYLEELF